MDYDSQQFNTSRASMRKFWIIFTAQAFSLFGSRLVQFSLVWWLTSESGLASVLAFASIMAVLPQVFIGPFAGTLVDRWNRRKVMIYADALIALVIIMLVLLFATDRIQVWHIYVAMFVRSFGGSFHWPAMQATTTLMVQKEHYTRVAGLNQSLHGLASIVAPPLGALLLELVSIEWILSIDVFTAVLAITPLLIMFIPQPVRTDLQQVSLRTVINDLKEGMRFVWNWKGLRYIMTMAMIINFLVNPSFSLLPLIITKHFLGGAYELAWIQSANGIGMITGGLLLGAWKGLNRGIKTAMFALIIGGTFITIFGLTPPSLFLIAVISVFIFALSNAIANGIFFSSLQRVVPPELQGRVFTLIMSSSIAVSPVGLALAGPIADIFGERIWLLLGGPAFAFMGFIAFFIPSIMNIEKEAERFISGETTQKMV
jgi:DHA3 family macrolide efflux protein-like MFS transporter